MVSIFGLFTFLSKYIEKIKITRVSQRKWKDLHSTSLSDSAFPELRIGQTWTAPPPLVTRVTGSGTLMVVLLVSVNKSEAMSTYRRPL